MKKNKFLTFCFAVIPGCGHMYLGYMKRGLQFMMMFAIFALFGFFSINELRSETISIFFIVLLPIIWFYQMFDSMHTISQMRRLEIVYPEDDGFFIPGFSKISNLDSLVFFKKPKVIKAIAAVLICIGAYVLFMNMSQGIYQMIYDSTSNLKIRDIYSNTYSTIMRYVPPVLISLGLIIVGIRLLKGNKKNRYNADTYISDVNKITETDIN